MKLVQAPDSFKKPSIQQSIENQSHSNLKLKSIALIQEELSPFYGVSQENSENGKIYLSHNEEVHNEVSMESTIDKYHIG